MSDCPGTRVSVEYPSGDRDWLGPTHCPCHEENAQLRAHLAQMRTILQQYRRHFMHADNVPLMELCAEMAAVIPDAPKEKP